MAKKGLIERILTFLGLGRKPKEEIANGKVKEVTKRKVEQIGKEVKRKVEKVEKEKEIKKPRVVQKKKVRKRAKRKPKKMVEEELAKEAQKELEKWKKRVGKLRKRIRKLEKGAKEKKVPVIKALGGIKVIYGSIAKEGEDIDTESRNTKYLMKTLETEYLKRRITGDEFRLQMLKYRQKLKLLELKKKDVAEEREELGRTAKSIRGVNGYEAIPADLESIARFAVPKGVPAEKAEEVIAAPKKVVEEERVVPTAPPRAEKVVGEVKAPPVKVVGEVKKPIVVPTRVHRIIEEKAKGSIDEKKLSEIEEKIGRMMKTYNVPQTEIERRVEKLDTTRILDSFNKLIDLVELEHKAKEIETVRPVAMPKAFPAKAKEVEKIKGIAIELKKHRIATDFDRIVSVVNEKGRIKLGDIAKLLSIDRKRVEECCNILEEEGLVEIEYPAIGDVWIEVKDYKEMRKQFEKKRKEAKEKIKKEKKGLFFIRKKKK